MPPLTADRKNYLTTKHGLHPYHFVAIDALLRETNLCGRSVLEIGGSNLPRELIVEDFKVDRWVAVDMIGEVHYARLRQVQHYQRERIYPLAEAENRLFSDVYTIFNGAAETINDSFAGKFDTVVSMAAFEHIGGLGSVLRKTYNSLQPGGILYSYFGPIYSCRVGHHCWINSEFNFNKLGKMPEFAHLLLKPAELLTTLMEHYPQHIAEEAVFQVYYSDRIGRNMYEDYEQYMASSPFEEFELRPFGVEPVDPDLQRRLEAACPGYRRFDAYGIEIVARKLVNNRSLGGR
jgi:SAM-dependent methyltransferase